MKNSRPLRIKHDMGPEGLPELDVTSYDSDTDHRSYQLTIGPDLLTVREVAALLRCGKNSVYELLHSGQLPYFKVGEVRGIRIPRAELERFVNTALRRDEQRETQD